MLFEDSIIKALAFHLRDGLTQQANAAFDALGQPRQIVVQQIALYRPALPSEGFPLLACYRTQQTSEGAWEVKFSWHIQGSTLIVEDQQNLLVWASKTATDLILGFPEVNPCAVRVSPPEIKLGYWIVSGNSTGNLSAVYPSIEGTFTMVEAHN